MEEIRKGIFSEQEHLKNIKNWKIKFDKTIGYFTNLRNEMNDLFKFLEEQSEKSTNNAINIYSTKMLVAQKAKLVSEWIQKVKKFLSS